MPVFKIKVHNGLEQLKQHARFILDDMTRMSDALTLKGTGWIPSVDLYENTEAVFLVADAAGVDRKTLNITLEGGLLCLSGVRHCPCDISGKYYHILEIEYGAFERIIRIPHEVEADSIEARYEDGLLLIVMPKKKNMPVKIDVS